MLINFKSILYIVPTPIGNMQDITERALLILQHVDLIAVENIYHTLHLLQHFSIKKKLFLLNNNNERKKSKKLCNLLNEGKNIALVSNAGTPLINDPGYYLVNLCHKMNLRVIPLPGACSAITALSASGLSTNRFCYEGFIPKKKISRYKKFKSLQYETRTIIFYEVKNRLINSMQDIVKIFGKKRYIVLAREITKIHESIKKDLSEDLLFWIIENINQFKGEIILIIEGYNTINNENNFFSYKLKKIIYILLKQKLSIKIIVNIISQMYNIKKNNILYQYILKKSLNNEAD